MNAPRTIEFSAAPAVLESAWIQRLKTALPASGENHGEEELQIPLRGLVLGGRQVLVIEDEEHNQVEEQEHNQVAEKKFCPRIDSKIDGHSIAGPKLDGRVQRSATGFGSFRVKLSNVKFRKPPLPPSSKAGKSESLDAQRRNQKILASKWNVHGVDMRLEQQNYFRSRKDLLAEFASRLDIREKPTPVGKFHVLDRKKLSSPTNKEMPCLTPVVVSPALIARVSDATDSMTASLSPEILQLESTKNSISVDKTTSNASVQANRSHTSTRTLSTACCGSSPFPLRTSTTISGSTEMPNAIQTEKCARVNENAEACLATGKRRSDASVTLSKEMLTPTSVKRSKVGVGQQPDASASLAGPWLNRWSVGVGLQASTNFDKVNSAMQQRRQPPSAAAMAIVGSTVRRLQFHSVPSSMKIFPNAGEQIQVTNLS